MAIIQTQCASFKKELYLAVHNFEVDTIKIALYTSDATLNASTTAYTTANEVSSSGTGYLAGGNTLSGATVSLSGVTAYVSFDNTAWSNSNITARGALIYNASKSNKAIAVLDFGADKTTANKPFVIQFPANDANSAIIRNV